MKVTEGELRRWGRSIGESVEPPLFIAMRGELGAGKSVLARAIARGAGVDGAVPSPTFNLLFRYEGRGGRALVHMDLYRISTPDELWELGWHELLHEDAIVLVEWPERAAGDLPLDRWEIEIHMVPGLPELREVSVSRVGTPPFLPGFPIALTGSGGGA